MRTPSLFAFVRSRSEEIISPDDLHRKLASRRKLRVKLGIDPTTPDLHLGHVVPLRMLKTFQDAGHQAVLIIGDVTARIGDPAGKTAARRQMSPAETKANERTYRSQIGKILNLARTEVRHNSEWFSRMRLVEFLDVLSRFSLKDATEREDFSTRLSAGRAVGLHEAMYPVLQAYDSVAVRADVELGSLDQKLNLLAGRELQAKLGRSPQDIVLLPYLLGLGGSQKMSKTAGDAINLRESAGEMFGKVMSIPDALIVNYAELGAWMSPEEGGRIRRRLERKENRRDIKLDVAEAVVRLYHSVRSAARAREEFLKLFSRRQAANAEMPSASLESGSYSAFELLVALRLHMSRSEARRLIAGGAVEVDGAVVRRSQDTIRIRRGSVIRVGKRRYFRVG